MHTITVVLALILITASFGVHGNNIESRSLSRINDLIEKEINLLEKMNQAVHWYAKGKKIFLQHPAIYKYWTMLNRMEFQRLEDEMNEIKSVKRRLISAVLKAFPQNVELQGIGQFEVSVKDIVRGDAALSAAYSELAVSDSVTTFGAMSDRAIIDLSKINWRGVAGSLLNGFSNDPKFGGAIKVLQKIIQNEKVSIPDLLSAAAPLAPNVPLGEIAQALQNHKPGDDLQPVLQNVLKGLQAKKLLSSTWGTFAELALNLRALLRSKQKVTQAERNAARVNLIRIAITYLGDKAGAGVSRAARAIGKFLDTFNTIKPNDKPALYKALLQNLADYFTQDRNPTFQKIGQLVQQYLASSAQSQKPPGEVLWSMLQAFAINVLKQSNNPTIQNAVLLFEMFINNREEGQNIPDIDRMPGASALPDPSNINLNPDGFGIPAATQPASSGSETADPDPDVDGGATALAAEDILV